MDGLREFWQVALLVSVPVSGLVGFVVHVLTVRKSSLEIEKLRLEIERLKKEDAKLESVIEVASFDQVVKYATEQNNRTPVRSSGCFIATAVYGSADAPEVVTLRSLRDQLLLPTMHGRAFVRCYYYFSPLLAKWLQHQAKCSIIVRKLLDIIVNWYHKRYMKKL